jgi:DNA-binding MarR family transcriptional regulator
MQQCPDNRQLNQLTLLRMVIERDPISDETTELAGRLRLAIGRLARQMRQHADSMLSLGQHSALSIIERFGPITLSEVAERERVSRPAVTRIIANLELKGLVERQTDATDRRVHLVSATRRGVDALEEQRYQRLSYLAEQLRQLDAHHLAVLVAAVEVLDLVAEQSDPSPLKSNRRP